ncbi:MAG: biosynthetic-type acetolactate synthase large subunit [Terriglobales bacterium]
MAIVCAIPAASAVPPRPTPAPGSGARLLCAALAEAGVAVIFGYPGGAVLPVYDELRRPEHGLRHVLARHEQGAVHMAEGWARASGRTGVALVTSGPGITNAVTGLANAMMDSTPLLVIAGQVPRALLGSDAFQETDVAGLTRGCTKESFAVRAAADIPAVVREALRLAAGGRPGPVVSELPRDVAQEQAVPVPAAAPPRRLSAPSCPRHAVEEAVGRLRAARRPVVYFGGGVVLAEAAAELRALVERGALPATPTLMGLGALPADHPCQLGMLGMHGSYAANQAVAASDVLLAVGARFDDRVTGQVASFAPRAEIIHLDVDASSFHKILPASLTLHGDARQLLRRLLAAWPAEPAAAATRLTGWWRQIAAWQRQAAAAEAHAAPADAGAIAPRQLCRELHRLTGGRALVVTDVGQHQMWMAQLYGLRRPRQFLTSGGLGAMGYGLPAAIGAQLACPRELVVAVVGDGGFEMSAHELATAVSAGAPVKVVIMNNRALGMVRQWQKLFYDRRYMAVDMAGQPDFVRLAAAYGATGLRAGRPDELPGVLARGLATPGVVVMDVQVDPEACVFPFVPPGAANTEMVLA